MATLYIPSVELKQNTPLSYVLPSRQAACATASTGRSNNPCRFATIIGVPATVHLSRPLPEPCPLGMLTTDTHVINPDLLAFIKA